MSGDRKLSEAELEALAHGRRDLAGEDAARAAADDDALTAAIEREQQASLDASVALKRAAPELDDLESMIAMAMAKVPATHETPAPAPSPASLWAGAALGASIAVASGVMSILASRDPGSLAHDAWSDASSLARLGLVMTTTVDRLVAHVPGGWGAVAGIGLVLFAMLVLPLRAMIGPVRLRATGTGALALALAITGASGTARAYELEGTWPEPDAQVSVDVDRTPLSEALRRALATSELGLAYTLPADPLVTLHVRDAPLREVLDALLADVPARVRHTGHLVVIRPSASAPADLALTDAIAENADAPSSVPGPPTSETGNAGAPPLPPPPTPPIAPQPAVQAPPAARAELRDVVTFGGDAHVRSGQQVRDVVTLGGDAQIDGEAFGNVLTLGGDVDVQGTVVGDVVSMGGDIDVARGGHVHGQLDSMGGDISVADAVVGEHGTVHVELSPDGLRAGRVERAHEDEGSWIGETLDAAMRHALLFLLGLLFMGLAPARLRTLQATIVKLPLRTLGSGFLGVIAGAVLTIVLVITILGIPAAIVLVLALFLGGYLGLATMASVIGAALPIRALANRPVLQLGVGVLVLFVVSRVPVIGGLLTVGATLGGLGAVIMTRLGEKPVAGATLDL